ncbi:ribonuclease G [Periweissella cryptocerci]|uniref:Ribonuclease G n=1 Tax=Periweissella cryptocerci TaxID=2506420 RepID=A0A4V1AIC9_9LACO|nr:ribonuclease G [Periweissella cryptocerci]QBO35065.1 ribonuclease G [Periweissella cryptocerci]
MENQMTPPEFNNAPEPDSFEKLKQYREQKTDFADDISRLHKWNWGAFSFGWIWGVGNNAYIMLLGLIPVVNLVMAIVGGINGNRWAYQNGDWRSVDEYLRAQRSWDTAGKVQFFIALGVFGLYAVVLIIGLVLGLLGSFD